MDSSLQRRGLELKVPPLVIGFLAAAFMWLIARSLPDFQLSFPGRKLLAGCLSLAGVAMVFIGVYTFRRSKTTINPMKPSATTSLVASGIYSISRNPMYVGFLLLLLGWAIFLAHWIAFAVLPLFILYMNRFQITPEERILASLFGSEFAEYQSRVRRWL